MRLSTKSIAIGICVPLTAALLGCPHVPTQEGVLSTFQEPAVTVTQLKMRVYASGQQVNAMIASAADSVRFRDTTKTVRERALIWKLSAIPAVQEASLDTDPGVAALDLWAFTVQQRNYFSTGDGRKVFGRDQAIAIAASQAIEQTLRKLIAGIRASNTIPEPADATVELWAAQHPIYGLDMHRPTVLGADWEMLGVRSTSITSAVGRFEQSLTDINQRIGYMNLGLLDRVAWQTELASESPLASRLDTLTGDMSIVMREAASLAATAPATLDAERRNVFDDLDGMRRRIFESIDGQRVATLNALNAQRVAISDDLRQERAAALAQADSITQRSIAQADSATHRSIDHADAVVQRLIRDVAVLLALLLILGGVIADIVINRAMRRRAVRA